MLECGCDSLDIRSFVESLIPGGCVVGYFPAFNTRHKGSNDGYSLADECESPVSYMIRTVYFMMSYPIQVDVINFIYLIKNGKHFIKDSHFDFGFHICHLTTY